METPVFDQYDELEKAYGDPRHLMYKKMVMVLEAIGGGDALLDFGCGQGELLKRVAGNFRRLAGVDATEESLKITAAKLGDRAELYKYGSAMPEMAAGFDRVTCLDVLEHLPDPLKALKEIYPLVSEGGRVIVTVPNWYDFITARVLKLNKFHLHAHTPWGWMAILKAAGFAVESCRAVSFPVVKSDLLARRVYFLGMCILIVAVKE